MKCQKVLLERETNLLGSVVEVKVIAASRWSVNAIVVKWIYCPHDALLKSDPISLRSKSDSLRSNLNNVKCDLKQKWNVSNEQHKKSDGIEKNIFNFVLLSIILILLIVNFT